MTVRAPAIVTATGVTYRQLDHWTSRGYLTPVAAAEGVEDARHPGSGRARIYDARAVEKTRLMVALTRYGLTPAAASAAADALLDSGRVDVGAGVTIVRDVA